MVKKVLEHLPNIEVGYISYFEMVEAAKHAKGVIRTGDITQLMNLILVCGINGVFYPDEEGKFFI